MGNEEKQNYEKENKVGDNPDSLTSEQLKQALNQMEKCICKIKKGNNIFGTGFFCKIPFPNQFILLPVLITCNHVLDENDISPGKKINFSLNNEQIQCSIIMNDSRKVYTNINSDATIIEINPDEDNISFESFLDIDENIYKDNPNEAYANKTVYILHYENGKVMKYSVGNIKSISEDTFNIRHLCTTDKGSSGGPIINLLNFKVMGIHKGYKGTNFNLGTHLRIVLNGFNDLYNKNKLKDKEKKEKNIVKEESSGKKDILGKETNLPNQKSFHYDPKKFNNIIYYDDNPYDLNSINQRSDYFEKNTNGAFILCTNIESLKLVLKELSLNINDSNNIFGLIINENNFENVIDFFRENISFENIIKRICIYGNNTSLNAKNKYITDIYANQKDIVENFIIKYSSREIRPYPIINNSPYYEDYQKSFKKIHHQISKYYGDLSSNSFEENFELLKKQIEEEASKKEGLVRDINKLLEGFSVFRIIEELEELDKLIIREYTKNSISYYLNRSLMNINISHNNPILYFISRLMYSLNSIALKHNRYLNKQEKIYRGVRIPYLPLLKFERGKGKIIFCSSFWSVGDLRVAKAVSRPYGNNELFSVIFEINCTFKKNCLSNPVYISPYSVFEAEREYLFLPFSFFHIKDVRIDMKNRKADIYLETIGKNQILEEGMKYGKEIEYNSYENIMQFKI